MLPRFRTLKNLYNNRRLRRLWLISSMFRLHLLQRLPPLHLPRPIHLYLHHRSPLAHRFPLLSLLHPRQLRILSQPPLSLLRLRRSHYLPNNPSSKLPQLQMSPPPLPHRPHHHLRSPLFRNPVSLRFSVRLGRHHRNRTPYQNLPWLDSLFPPLHLLLPHPLSLSPGNRSC